MTARLNHPGIRGGHHRPSGEGWLCRGHRREAALFTNAAAFTDVLSENATVGIASPPHDSRHDVRRHCQSRLRSRRDSRHEGHSHRRSWRCSRWLLDRVGHDAGPCTSGGQQHVRLVVGRSGRRTRHRHRDRQGRPRRVEGRRLLHARRSTPIRNRRRLIDWGDGGHRLRGVCGHVHDGHVRVGGARTRVRTRVRPWLRVVECLRVPIGSVALRRGRTDLGRRGGAPVSNPRYCRSRLTFDSVSTSPPAPSIAHVRLSNGASHPNNRQLGRQPIAHAAGPRPAPPLCVWLRCRAAHPGLRQLNAPIVVIGVTQSLGVERLVSGRGSDRSRTSAPVSAVRRRARRSSPRPGRPS